MRSVVLVLVLAASANAQEPTVTVVVRGDRVDDVRSAAEEADLPVRLRFADAPNVATSVAPESDDTIATARDRYLDTEFEACVSALGGELRVTEAIGGGNRERASRLAFWGIACRAVAGDRDTATRLAERFATWRLDVPGDVSLATPDIEHLMVDAAERVAARPLHPVRFEASTSGRVQVDAQEECSTPCAIDLPPGDHVARFESPGWNPEVREVRAGPNADAVRFEPERAGPELAAEQWSARFAVGSDIESTASVELLAQAVRARYLVLLLSDAEGPHLRLRGVASRDGRVVGRATRSDEVDEATREVLREVLVSAELVAPEPPLVRRPLFWVAIIGAALVAAAIPFAVLYERPVEREVAF